MSRKSRLVCFESTRYCSGVKNGEKYIEIVVNYDLYGKVTFAKKTL